MNKATIIALVIIFIFIAIIIVLIVILYYRKPNQNLEYSTITARNKLLVDDIDVGPSIIRLEAEESTGGPMLHSIQFKYNVTETGGISNIEYYVYPNPAIDTVTTSGGGLMIRLIPSLRIYNFGTIKYSGFEVRNSGITSIIYKMGSTGEIDNSVTWNRQDNPDLISGDQSFWIPIWTMNA